MIFCKLYRFSFVSFICHIFLFAVAGDWAEWGQWSECDPSCSCGKKIRARACANAPSAASCNGDPTETAPCSSESSNHPVCHNTTNPGGLTRTIVKCLYDLFGKLYSMPIRAKSCILYVCAICSESMKIADINFRKHKRQHGRLL